jgi:hypothetical protein
MATKIHVDLSEDGLEGQWIDVANILLKSPRQFQVVQDLANDTSAGKAFIAATITAWHVKNPITGEPLPAPDSPDLDLDDLPMIVSVRFQETVKAQMDSIGPKATSSANS